LLLADPGLGKTRLYRDFLARKRDRAIGLSARGYPLGTAASFGIWAEALEPHLRTLDDEQIRALCGGYLDDLASLFRTVAAIRGTAPQSEPARLRLIGGLSILVSNLARRTPIILLIDDAHDADPSSWEALAYVSGDLAKARVLVLVAARPYELSENQVATEIAARMEQDGVLRRMALKPLDASMIRRLAESALDRPPSKTLVEWLAERSRGNPLFVLGLLQAVLDEGADLSAPALGSIPEPLAERVLARLNTLDAASIEVVELLATIARRVDLRELATLSALPSAQLFGALKRLVRSRLVIEDDRGVEINYEVAHPLVQEAIYRHIAPAHRCELHRAIGRALFAAGSLGEAASHFVRSAAVEDDEAIGAVRDAVRQAEARGAYREALTGLDALAHLIPAGDPRWLNVLDALSWRAEWVIDHRADTHGVLGVRAMKAIDLAMEQTADPMMRGFVKFRLSNFLAWGAGDLEEGERACSEARALFEKSGDTASVLLARVEASWIHVLKGDCVAMEEEAETVAALADAAEEPFARLQAHFARGVAAAFRGRFRKAEAALQLSNTIAQEHGKLYRLTVGFTLLGIVAAAQGRTEQAFEFYAQGKRANPAWRDSLMPEFECTVRWLAGDFDGALACANDAASHATSGLSRRRAFGVAFAALAAAEAGQIELASRHADRAVRAYDGRHWHFFSHYCGHPQGLIDWQQGKTVDACKRLRETGTSLLAIGALPFAAFVLADLAEIAAEIGEIELAVECEGRLGTIAARVECEVYAAMYEVGRACAAFAGGDGDWGAAAAHRAITLLAGSGCRFFYARAVDRLGRSLARQNSREAVTELGRAANLYGACGAVWRRDRTGALLRILAAPGRRTAGALLGPIALSARERQVACLAAQGRTAPEIATHLSISERTVETHLNHVYSKLGIRSKIELVRRASELGL
jgi:DNA-binding CsgD family transcriptional regulator